jgi:hypothetical protein
MVKPRTSTIVLTVAYFLAFICVARIAPTFVAIYADLYPGDYSPPSLTRLVLALAPVGWTLLALASALVLIAKDLHPLSRRISNGLFFVLLPCLCLAVLVALFTPLVITISAVGSPCETPLPDAEKGCPETPAPLSR